MSEKLLEMIMAGVSISFLPIGNGGIMIGCGCQTEYGTMNSSRTFTPEQREKVDLEAAVLEVAETVLRACGKGAEADEEA